MFILSRSEISDLNMPDGTGISSFLQKTLQTLPLTVRRAIEVLGLAVIFLFIIYAADIVSPILLSFFLTILLYPMFKWLRSKKVPEMVSIIIVLVVLLAGMICGHEPHENKP